MSNQKEYMTEEGLEKLEERQMELEKELEDLRRFKGEEAIRAGDTWHDNPTFYEAEAKERVLMRQIADIKEKILKAEIIPEAEESDVVILGSTVTIRFSDGATQTFRILGEADSDPRAGIVSYKSPLGRALIGGSVGDTVTYEVEGFTENIEILEIVSTELG